MMTPEEEDVLTSFANVKSRKEDKSAFWMGVGFVIICLCVPACQSVLWLQSGAWMPFAIADGFHFIGWNVPTTTWAGAQKIIAWLFDLPVWSIPALLAFGCFSAWKETT